MADPTTQDSPLSPEIVKLTERLAKDPKSRLFVPLAEEYLKSGMLDEALMVLKDGLKIHPNFLSAKTALGKAYSEKGEVAQARAVFEEVVAANPDNLLVHRRLARIYKDGNETERARTSCQVVLDANPKDSEMKSLMDEIQALLSGGKSAAVASPEEERTETFVETTSVTAKVSGAAPKESPAERESTAAAPADRSEAPVERPTAAREESALKEPVVPGAALRRPVVPEVQAPVSPAPAAETEASDIATESLADLYVKQGYYEKGLEIYRKILAEDPARDSVRRKLDQTESLMAILAKDEKAAAAVRSETRTFPAESREAEKPESVTTETRSDSPSSNDKVRRLEAWLESIRKGQGR